MVLKEFYNMLLSKKLTPEAFFRTCDASFSQCVATAEFRAALKNHGVMLTDA